MSAGALEFLKGRAAEKEGRLVVPFFACREAAREGGISPRDVEILALENGICPSRYEKNIGTIGMAGQAKLLRSRAAVIGCGGLGGWAVDLLARAGVGELVLIDGDSFDDGNLNRQLLATEKNIGAAKAEAAAARIIAVNKAISVFPYPLRLTAENARGLLEGCAAAVDALDNNSSRREAFKACRELGIPFVHGAIGGFFAQVGVFYPEDKPFWMEDGAPDRGVETETGNPPFTPAFAAALQAAETVKILAGLDCRLKDILLWFDIKNYDMQSIKLGKAE